MINISKALTINLLCVLENNLVTGRCLVIKKHFTTVVKSVAKDGVPVPNLILTDMVI